MATGPTIGVEVLDLGSVELPPSHPRYANGSCVVLAFLIHHPDGVILVDSGVGDDSDLIDELFRPTTVPVIDALHQVGVDERDVVALVNTHLHFDHCGQNRRFPTVPVHVQAAELEAATQPRFTIPEWAAIEPRRRRVHDGDGEIAPGVTLLATPGHTPGHQSVLITDGDRRTVIVGQCCYTCAEFEAGEVLPADLHDDSMLDVGVESLERLRRLDPAAAHLSHDRATYRAARPG